MSETPGGDSGVNSFPNQCRGKPPGAFDCKWCGKRMLASLFNPFCSPSCWERWSNEIRYEAMENDK